MNLSDTVLNIRHIFQIDVTQNHLLNNLMLGAFTCFRFPWKSVVIDDASAARVQKLLTISNVVSNLPLIIVALGAIMLAIFIVLLIRARQQKVGHHFTYRDV